MRLELAIRLDSPMPRETADREANATVRNPEHHGPDVEGDLGNSARCRVRPYFVGTSTGEPDRALVERIDLAIDFTDPRDVDAVVDGVFAFGSALAGPVCTHAGAPIDRDALREQLQELVRERNQRRLMGHAAALLGAVALLAGGVCLYGFDVPDPIGPESHHVHFVGIGFTIITGGVVALGWAMTAALRD